MRSFRQVLSLSLASLLLATTFAACDGGGDNRKVSSLSAAEAKQVCEDQRSSASDGDKKALAKFACVLGLTFAGPGECTAAAVDSCVADMLAHPQQGECNLGVDLPKCDVTVDQLVTCGQDQIDAIASAADKLTCENVSSPGTLPQDPPASCKIVKEKCPSAFEHQSSKMKMPF